MSYPGVSFSDALDTLCTPLPNCLPLAAAPHLLTPTADRHVIFGAPSTSRTVKQHRQVSSGLKETIRELIDYQMSASHGQESAHQSLAKPASPITTILHPPAEEMDMEVTTEEAITPGSLENGLGTMKEDL